MSNRSTSLLKHRKEKKLRRDKIRSYSGNLNCSKKQKMLYDELTGAIIFKNIQTISTIPPAEYIPTRNSDGHGVLVPIKRNRKILSKEKITESDTSVYNAISEEIYDDLMLKDLEELLLEDSDFVTDKTNTKNSFIPVQSYFPMEKYNPGLKSAKENIIKFLNAHDIYESLNMDYRRGILFYGEPGTGKSQFIYQLSQELIEDWQAIVIRIEDSTSLNSFYEYIMSNLSESYNRLKVIVIEELADLCSSSSNISVLLSLLDSLVLRDNVLFLLTTNHPGRIPANIVDRPSRLDLLCPINNKDFKSEFVDAWFEFCTGRKISEEEKDQSWYGETHGKLSPAYFKELFLYSQLHVVSIDESWILIKDRRNEIQSDFNNRNGVGF
ncbi:MAG: AAA family ATPase [Balneolaceae bacterium]